MVSIVISTPLTSALGVKEATLVVSILISTPPTSALGGGAREVTLWSAPVPPMGSSDMNWWSAPMSPVEANEVI